MRESFIWDHIIFNKLAQDSFRVPTFLQCQKQPQKLLVQTYLVPVDKFQSNSNDTFQKKKKNLNAMTFAKVNGNSSK